MSDHTTPQAHDSRFGITLETFILEGMLGHPAATGTFTSILNQISFAAKLITSKVRRAGLVTVEGAHTRRDPEVYDALFDARTRAARTSTRFREAAAGSIACAAFGSNESSGAHAPAGWHRHGHDYVVVPLMDGTLMDFDLRTLLEVLAVTRQHSRLVLLDGEDLHRQGLRLRNQASLGILHL